MRSNKRHDIGMVCEKRMYLANSGIPVLGMWIV